MEQRFSQCGQILSEKRSKLLPETLEGQVCLNDWKMVEMRIQNNDHLIESDSDEELDDDTMVRSSDAKQGEES